MATVSIHPGDTLNVVVDIVKTPRGNANVVMPFLYEDIMAILAPKRKRKNSANRGGRESRQVNLFCSALLKGVWTTGAPIRRTEIADKLVVLLSNMSTEDMKSLSPKAVEALGLLKSSSTDGIGAGLSVYVNQVLAVHNKIGFDGSFA